MVVSRPTLVWPWAETTGEANNFVDGIYDTGLFFHDTGRYVEGPQDDQDTTDRTAMLQRKDSHKLEMEKDETPASGVGRMKLSSHRDEEEKEQDPIRTALDVCKGCDGVHREGQTRSSPVECPAHLSVGSECRGVSSMQPRSCENTTLRTCAQSLKGMAAMTLQRRRRLGIFPYSFLAACRASRAHLKPALPLVCGEVCTVHTPTGRIEAGGRLTVGGALVDADTPLQFGAQGK